MSLDWSVEKIKDYKTVCWRDIGDGKVELRKKTDILIWATMKVDLTGITKKNINDWMRRIAVCKKLGHPFGDEFYKDANGDKKCREYYPDRATLEEHIGLGTNVSTIHFTRWYKKLCEQTLKDIDWELQNDRNE